MFYMPKYIFLICNQIKLFSHHSLYISKSDSLGKLHVDAGNFLVEKEGNLSHDKVITFSSTKQIAI